MGRQLRCVGLACLGGIMAALIGGCQHKPKPQLWLKGEEFYEQAIPGNERSYVGYTEFRSRPGRGLQLCLLQRHIFRDSRFIQVYLISVHDEPFWAAMPQQQEGCTFDRRLKVKLVLDNGDVYECPTGERSLQWAQLEPGQKELVGWLVGDWPLAPGTRGKMVLTYQNEEEALGVDIWKGKLEVEAPFVVERWGEETKAQGG